MKTHFFLPMTVALATLLTMQSCSEQDHVARPIDQSESIITQRSTLSQILANGVTDTSDFDVLRSNNIYPFNVLSNTDFSDMKAATVFRLNKLVGNSYPLMDVLTENQFKIWLKIVLHGNITLQNSWTFVSPIQNEPQYATSAGMGDRYISMGYQMDPVEDPDTCEWYCPDGLSFCIEPFIM